ncbi:unnamed protein product, partial [Didymodactylos carnosus]
ALNEDIKEYNRELASLTMSMGVDLIPIDYDKRDMISGDGHHLSDSGVRLSHDMKWATHIREVATSCRKTLGVINRVFGEASQSIRLVLYLTCVLPETDYCSALYDSKFTTHLEPLEAVKRLASRIITRNFNYETDSLSLVNKLGLPDPSVRRRQPTSERPTFERPTFERPIGWIVWRCRNLKLYNVAATQTVHTYPYLPIPTRTYP